MAKKSKKKLTTKKPVEPKPFHEVAAAVDAYAVSSLMDDLGPALWDLLGLFSSPVFVVSPGTDEEAKIRPVANNLMLEHHVRNGKDQWRLVEWSEVKDELARPE